MNPRIMMMRLRIILKIILGMIIICHRRPWITMMMVLQMMSRIRTSRTKRMRRSRSKIMTSWLPKSRLLISIKAFACLRCCWTWARIAIFAAAAASAAAREPI